MEPFIFPLNLKHNHISPPLFNLTSITLWFVIPFLVYITDYLIVKYMLLLQYNNEYNYHSAQSMGT